MNGIVTGKVEVPSGSLVWKPSMTYNFPSQENQDVEVKIGNLGAQVTSVVKIIPLDFYNNPLQPDLYIPIGRIPDTSNANTGLGFSISQWGYSQEIKVYVAYHYYNSGDDYYLRFRGYNNYVYPSDYLKGFEIGTLS
nr:MAG TPA: hypothetical protein [Caudoviricetes sp.]